MHALFHASLQNQLKVEAEFQLMISANRCDVMVLYQLIKRICDGSTHVIVEDVLGNLADTLHNFSLIQGEEYDTLQKHMEDSQYRFEVLKMAGFTWQH